MAAPEENSLRSLVGNVLDDLLLVDGVIKLAGQMDELEKKIIDIKVKCPFITFLDRKSVV